MIFGNILYSQTKHTLILPLCVKGIFYVSKELDTMLKIFKREGKGQV
jgi:hypothetical protein